MLCFEVVMFNLEMQCKQRFALQFYNINTCLKINLEYFLTAENVVWKAQSHVQMVIVLKNAPMLMKKFTRKNIGERQWWSWRFRISIRIGKICLIQWWRNAIKEAHTDGLVIRIPDEVINVFQNIMNNFISIWIKSYN